MSSTIEAAAQAAGIGERTAYRYLKIPDVRQALSAALDDAMGQVTRQTVEAMGRALQTLEAIHQDEAMSPSARVSAARSILDAGPKLREAMDLTERVTTLEEKERHGKYT